MLLLPAYLSTPWQSENLKLIQYKTFCTSNALLSSLAGLRGCFALRKQTRHFLGLSFDYHMRAQLVTELIQTLTFATPGWIWHSDQGKQYGAEATRTLLLQKGGCRNQ